MEKHPNYIQGDEAARRAAGVWAAGCAERVLPHFESRHPDDNRPRVAIEVLRAWIRGDVKIGVARQAAVAAHAAAREAEHPAAIAAARAAGQAVAVAHMKGHANAAAKYGIKSFLAESGQVAADAERERQEASRPPELPA